MKDILQEAIIGMIRGPGQLMQSYCVNDTATNNRCRWLSIQTGGSEVHMLTMEE